MAAQQICWPNKMSCLMMVNDGKSHSSLAAKVFTCAECKIQSSKLSKKKMFNTHLKVLRTGVAVYRVYYQRFNKIRMDFLATDSINLRWLKAFCFKHDYRSSNRRRFLSTDADWTPIEPRLNPNTGFVGVVRMGSAKLNKAWILVLVIFCHINHPDQIEPSSSFTLFRHRPTPTLFQFGSDSEVRIANSDNYW